MSAPSVSSALARDRNNFAPIRLALALAVVVSHAFSVTTGVVTDEPLTVSTGFTLGEHAVNGFFAISGFLVTMSFDRRGWRDYAIARTLRIAPGLIVAVLAVSLLLGAAMTALPLDEYLQSPGLRRFVTATLTSFKSNIALPGVFADNPFTFPMGTVWTLKYEVMCYAGVFLIGLVGLLRSRLAALVLVAGLALGLVGLDLLRPDAPKSMETALRLPLIFAFGGALYVWRDRARLSGSRPADPHPCHVAERRNVPLSKRCSSPERPTASCGSRWRRRSRAFPTSRRPTCPTAPISTAGRSSRACMRSGRASPPACCWCRRSRSRC